jgi:hypothetical protein
MSTLATPEQTQQMIEMFNDMFPDAAHSFAHDVLGDFNLGDGHIKFCQNKYEGWIHQQLRESKGDVYQNAYLIAQSKAIYGFLDILHAIPEDVRDAASELMVEDF